MIRFIASDLDGTILLNGAQSVDESLFDVISQLVDQGIIFAPASGRQLESLKKLFAPISDKLMFISENGALVEYKNDIIVKETMDRELALDIINDIYNQENCEVLISGVKTAYIKPKTEEYRHRMQDIVKYETTIIEDFRDIKEDILKVSVCDLSGIVNSSEHFHNKWGEQATVAVSGALYLDFTNQQANKGNAVKSIQEKLGILPEECMAFGDNFNDIAMLQSVVHSYAMEKATDVVKKHANNETSWVEGTLREKFKIQ